MDDVFVAAEYVGQFLEIQLAAVVVGVVGDLLRSEQPVFGPADLGSDVLLEPVLRGESAGFHSPRYHSQLVFAVQDGELWVDYGVAQVGAEQGIAAGVKGARIGAVLPPGRQVGHALAHFLGGFPGESDAEDAVAGYAAFRDQMGGAVGDGAGFAGAGAGDNQQGAVLVLDSALLVGVQVVQ